MKQTVFTAGIAFLFVFPQVVVLWVGTNNHEHTADQVAGGILAIAQLLLSRLPKSKIIVLVSHLNHYV